MYKKVASVHCSSVPTVVLAHKKNGLDLVNFSLMLSQNLRKKATFVDQKNKNVC